MHFIDLATQYKTLKSDIDAGIAAVLNHGQFIMGPEVMRLESQLCEFTGAAHCVTCASGTDALQMLYMAYGVGAGDAVFCPDVTFIASIEPACMLGATPVFCDITADTYNICPESLERQIKAVLADGVLKPKAVVAVDFLGNPVDYDALRGICGNYGLTLIEDAAQSFGAAYRGQKCGGLGIAAATSFFPAKPLGCYGDGGAIFTDDEALAHMLKSLRMHGAGTGGKYHNVRVGLNSRLDTMQAAVLLPKLRAFSEYEIEKRQCVAARYNEAFATLFQTPYVAPESKHVYAQYAVLAADKQSREAALLRLRGAEIPSMIYYPIPQHMLPVFEGLPCYGEKFENSTNYCARTFSLPMHPYLKEEDQDRVVAAVLGR